MCHKILHLPIKEVQPASKRFCMSNTLHTMNNFQYIVLTTKPRHEQSKNQVCDHHSYPHYDRWKTVFQLLKTTTFQGQDLQGHTTQWHQLTRLKNS